MTEVDTRVDQLPDFENASNEEIVGFFEQHPKYGSAFGLDSGVWQEYTIREHTLMVMHQFDRYLAPHFRSPLLSLGEFRVMLALHDIGKGVAVVDLKDKEKGRERQHEYTAKIIPEMIEDFDLDERTKMLITAIPINDVMGGLLRKHRDPVKDAEAVAKKKVLPSDEAALRVRGMADVIGVDSGELLDLYYVYFLSDAGSYTHDADPSMGEPPEGREDLDHLFVFDRKSGEETGSVRLDPELEARVRVVRQHLAVN